MLCTNIMIVGYNFPVEAQSFVERFDGRCQVLSDGEI